jgi:hypothetical protein
MNKFQILSFYTRCAKKPSHATVPLKEEAYEDRRETEQKKAVTRKLGLEQVKYNDLKGLGHQMD